MPDTRLPSLHELRARDPDVERFLQEVRAGGSPTESFQPIYERYCAPVTHYFANRGFSDQEAEDLAQDSLLRVYRSMGEFRFEASFDTWLFRIVENVWKNELRHRGAQKRQAEEVPLDLVMSEPQADGAGRQTEPVAPAAGPLEQVLADERTQVLERAIAELPPKMRRCVLLREGQGLKYREIAAVLQVSIATVKSQLNAARQRLKPVLEPDFDLFFP